MPSRVNRRTVIAGAAASVTAAVVPVVPEIKKDQVHPLLRDVLWRALGLKMADQEHQVYPGYWVVTTVRKAEFGNGCLGVYCKFPINDPFESFLWRCDAFCDSVREQELYAATKERNPG